MRLTNVAHLRLPFGRLMGYDVTVSEPGAVLPVSFDQRRHVGAGERGGSWMALSFRLTDSVGLDELAAAWLAGRGVQRIQIATRDGRLLAELVLAPPGPPPARAEKAAPAAFRP